jgi:hypothetical protein
MRSPVGIVASAVLLSSPLACARTALPPVPPPRAETVLLHVEGPSAAEVLGRSGRSAEWTTVCRGPCDEEVPLDWEYRVQGGGMKASDTFNLRASAGQSVVVVHVDPASKGWFIAGIVGMSTAGAVFVIGVAVTATQSIGCGIWCESQMSNQLLGIVGVAVVLLVSGSAATFTNLSTTISQGKRPEPIPDQEVWHTAGRREALPFPAATGAPLVTVRF